MSPSGIKLSAERIAELRRLHAKGGNDFREQVEDDMAALLDLAEEALRARALEIECHAAEEEYALEGDEDARLTLCRNQIGVGHVRHVLRYLRGER